MTDVGATAASPLWEGRKWTLKEKATLQLRTVVLRTLEPGDVRTQEALIKQVKAEFGCSRTPAREALCTIAAEGLIRLVPRLGLMVASVDSRELREILAITLALETLATRELVAQEEPNLGELESLQREMEGLVHSDLPEAKVRFVDLDVEFHSGLAREAGCRNAETLLRRLRNRTRPLVKLKDITPAKRNEVLGEHQALLHALKSRDARKVEKATRDHLLKRARRWFDGQEAYLRSLDLFAPSAGGSRGPKPRSRRS